MNRRAVSPFASGSTLAGAAFRITLFAVLVLVGLPAARLCAESANTDFKRGQSAEARQDYDAALDFYQKANAKDPKELAYRASLYRLRTTTSAMHVSKGRKLIQAGDQQGALAEFIHASEIDPGNEAAQQEIARIRQKNGEAAPVDQSSLPIAPEAQQAIDGMGAPPELKPLSSEPLTLRMTEDAKAVYQAVGKAAGVNVLFDPDFTSKRIQVDLTNVSLLDALRIVGTLSNTFWRPVTANTIFVAQNTRAKRTEIDEQAVQTFYLTNAWQQNDLNDVQTALRNVLPNAKVYGVASQNAIVMRGTPDELLLAQKLIDDLDKARAEVVVDIAVLEVSSNWEKTLGIAWPTSVGVALQPPTSSTSATTTTTSGTTTTSTSPTLYDLSHLKASDFAVTVGSATANLLLTDSNTKILQNPRIRAIDSQKADMKIGQRIPIATGSYQTGAATAMVSSLVNTQFQYIDVGVEIEMTPTIHFDNDVTLKMKITVSSENGQVNISGVTEPIISQRVVDQVIRLREGEASILGGIQEKQDQVNWTGIPGLSSIPILKYLFGSKDHTITNDELVFLVVPHIVRTQTLDRVNLRTIDTGTGQSIELRHIPVEVPISVPVGNPSTAPPPAPSARSTVGTVPSQSAAAAAPALLAQLNAVASSNDQMAAVAVNQPASTAPPAGSVSLTLNAPGHAVAVGATFQVPIVLTGGVNIASVPVQLKYDPARLSLVNVAPGDLLGRDGQAVALVHRDDGPGSLIVDVARPPGAAGVSGAGVACVLSFQARSAGQTVLAITRPAAINSAQQQVPATGSQVNITVQ
jgi:general secretion pathway protein D